MRTNEARPQALPIAMLAAAAWTASTSQDVRSSDELAKPVCRIDRACFRRGVRDPRRRADCSSGLGCQQRFLAGRSSGVDVRPLLGGQPGNVFAMPDAAAPVLLAVTTDRRCAVWAERMSGPSLRRAFQQATAQLATRGARVQTVLDHTVERAGAWRQHLQIRYRRVGGSQDFGIGAVTTVAAPRVAGPALRTAARDTTRDRDRRTGGHAMSMRQPAAIAGCRCARANSARAAATP